jgi:hypothetical protein
MDTVTGQASHTSDIVTVTITQEETSPSIEAPIAPFDPDLNVLIESSGTKYSFDPFICTTGC